MSLKAIETTYRGFRFRSRLEARWAVFFDALKIRWEYEPEGYVLPGGECYLPDFYLPERRFFAEIKHENAAASDFDKAIALAKSSGVPILLLSGSPEVAPFPCFDPVHDQRTDCVFQSCGVGLYSDQVYWNSGGGMRPEDVDDMCRGFSAAVDCARSARFEFGESGA